MTGLLLALWGRGARHLFGALDLLTSGPLYSLSLCRVYGSFTPATPPRLLFASLLNSTHPCPRLLERVQAAAGFLGFAIAVFGSPRAAGAPPSRAAVAWATSTGNWELALDNRSFG